MWFFGSEVEHLTGAEFFNCSRRRKFNATFEALHDDLTRCFVFRDFLAGSASRCE